MLDIHQHLMLPPLVDALRRRRQPPLLDGWTLHREDSPPTVLDARHFDVEAREAELHHDGCDAALVSLSSPLGLERLSPDQAQPLLDLYHDSVASLPDTFAGWAATSSTEPDVADLDQQLARGFVGLQLPATDLLTPAAVDRVGPTLSVLERHDKPLLVHPGPAAAGIRVPPWWTAVVSFVQQMHAVWHAWQVAGLSAFPDLRVCFVALAGLAPLHADRVRARAGSALPVSTNVFYETSSYGTQTVDILRQKVAGRTIVYGSDRPYAEPSQGAVDPRLARTLRTTNAWRLLTGRHSTAGTGRQADGLPSSINELSSDS